MACRGIKWYILKFARSYLAVAIDGNSDLEYTLDDCVEDIEKMIDKERLKACYMEYADMAHIIHDMCEILDCKPQQMEQKMKKILEKLEQKENEVQRLMDQI